MDKRQKLHFEQLFSSLEYFNFPTKEYEHISFGTVNDADGNPFKTREGGTKKLTDLYDETYQYIKAINNDLDECYFKITNLIDAIINNGYKDYDPDYIRSHVDKLTS